MIETEQRLERATDRMAARESHGLAERAFGGSLTRSASGSLHLGGEQQAALEHITGPGDLAIVTGYAGTGKSAMLGVARGEWEAAGYEVRGIALSGIAAENLESGSGIASRTIASLEHQWGQNRELLTDKSILVIDEAGMIGTRQMERVITEAEKRRAKVVLVGDPEQLQAIEADASFRSIAERHAGVEITEVRRQSEDWQRDATRHLATGRTGEAIDAYEQAGRVHAAETREVARGQLIDRWDKDRQAKPLAGRIILTHTNDEVRELNEAARGRMHAAGDLGDDITLQVERGSRDFASGDRVMFLKNERGLGVKNGSLGTIRSVNALSMAVTLDDGRGVTFDLKDWLIATPLWNRLFGVAAGEPSGAKRLIDCRHLAYSPRPMSLVSRALSPLAPIAALPLLMAQIPAHAAPARARHVSAKNVSAPAKATTDIIALPLNPVLPAGQRLCAATTAAGLGYTMLRPAAGAMPTEADFVLVNYIGYLAATGAVFDQGVRASFPVNGVIPGFSRGLQMLARTGIARLCIPAAMGYGAQGSGPIPANSDLVFQVELIDYKTAAEIDAMRKASAAPSADVVAPQQ
jgi:hypothetical protein